MGQQKKRSWDCNEMTKTQKKTTAQETAPPGVNVQRLVSAFSENDCLACGPFDGDFGSPDDRILKDKMVTARKAGACFLCEREITPGERIRTMAAVFDGELMSYRWCNACCAAMAKSWLDDGDA